MAIYHRLEKEEQKGIFEHGAAAAAPPPPFRKWLSIADVHPSTKEAPEKENALLSQSPAMQAECTLPVVTVSFSPSHS